MVSQWGTHTMENEVKEKELKKTGESGYARMRRILLPALIQI